MNTETQKTQNMDLPSWHFRPSNLGCLKENPGEIEFKPLTLICGPNNTGKTWVMYALYGFFKSLGKVELPELEDFQAQPENSKSYSFDASRWFEGEGIALVDSIKKQILSDTPAALGLTEKVLGNGRFDWIFKVEQLRDKFLQSEVKFQASASNDGYFSFTKKKGDFRFEVSAHPEISDTIKFFIAKIIRGCIFWGGGGGSVFLLPAERNGLGLLQREVYGLREKSYRSNSNDFFGAKDPFHGKGNYFGQYAEAINDYMEWLYIIPNIEKNDQWKIVADKVERLSKGSYIVNPNSPVGFLPLGANDDLGIDLRSASSAAKGLFGLWAFLRYGPTADEYILLIDEPELNLHPASQRVLARLLVQLVNDGFRIIVSTHSDYFVREINSLLMLSRPHAARQGLMDKFGYAEGEVLHPEQVAAWLFTDGKIAPMKIDAVEGIHAQTFDDEIHQLNDTSDSIYYAYQDDSESGA